jgi:ribosomal-protein-alanine N-acetyltransferase
MRPPFFRRAPPAEAPPRFLTPADAAGCATLHAGSFAHPWSAVEFESLLADSACVADGLGERAKIAGFILSRKAADEAEILTIVVEGPARRRGLARRILGAHLARLGAHGVVHVFLEVEDGNGAALALYRRFGFVETGRRRSYYAKADGRRADAITMRLTLR